MPMLIAIVVLSFLAGLVAKRPAALAVAVGLGVLANAAFVWTIADGKGDDSAWILLLSLGAAGLAVGAARFAGSLREGRDRAAV